MSDTSDPWGTPSGESADSGESPDSGQPAPTGGQQPGQRPGQPGAEPSGAAGAAPYPPPAYGQPAPPPGYGQPTPPPGGGPPPPYGYGQQQQPAWGAQPYSGGPQTSGKATTVLVLGIASLVLMVTCGLGFIAAIIALVMANGARREIRESGGRLTGEGQIKAGVIMSWITIGLTTLGLVALIALIAVGVSTDSSSDAPVSRVETSIGAQAGVASDRF